MATKRTEKVTVTEGENELAVVTDEPTPAEEELQAALAEIGETEVRVQVQKTLPKDEAGACSTYAAQEFSIDRLRDDWGGGTYMLYFRLPNGTLKTKRRIQVLAKKMPPTPPDHTAEILAALQKNTHSDMTPMLALIQAQQKNTTDMIVAMFNSQSQNKQQPIGVTEIVALMTGIAQLTKGKDNDASAVDNLLKGVKLMKELGGDGDDKSTLLSTIATVATPLLEKISERQNANQNIPQNSTAVRTPIPVEARTVATPARATPTAHTSANVSMGATPHSEPADGERGSESTEEITDVNLNTLIWAREMLALVLEKAKANRDPELYADYVLDNIPAEITYDMAYEQLKSANCINRLAMLDSRVLEYAEWFEEFRQAIVDRIEESRAFQETQAAPEPQSFNDSPNSSNDETHD